MKVCIVHDGTRSTLLQLSFGHSFIHKAIFDHVNLHTLLPQKLFCKASPIR